MQKSTSKRCACKTAKGEQCKNNAVEGSKYCAIHKKKCAGVVSKAKAKAKAPKAKAKAKKIDMEELRERVEAYAIKNPEKGLQDLFDAMEERFGEGVGELKREIAQFAVDILGQKKAKAKAKKAKEKVKAKKAKEKVKAKKAKKVAVKKTKASEPKEKLLAVVKKLQNVEAKSRGEEEIYFAGEYDPEQSDFEKRSNGLEIGVLTKGGPKVGFAALHILRYIIDKTYPSQFMDDMEDAKDAKKTLLKFMVEEEERYGSHFPPGGLIRARLDDRMIEKTIDEVDVWTLDKIEKRVKRFK